MPDDIASGDWLPTVAEIEHAPQLAVLAALQGTLEAADCALSAAHPEIALDPECPYWAAGAHRLAAERVLALVQRLQRALLRYRDTAAPDADDEPSREDILDLGDGLLDALDSDDDIPW